MSRGELYRVFRGNANDSKEFRVFVVVSRQPLIDSKFSTVICAPVYSNFLGLSTQVEIGLAEGLKHESAIHCDELVSIQKARLTDRIGSLGERKLSELNRALAISVGIAR